MSIQIKKNELTEFMILDVKKKLIIDLEYIKIHLYFIKDEYIYLPFSYYYTLFPYKKSENIIDKNNHNQFYGKLSEEQENIKNKIIKKLTNNGTCILSASTGFGKTVLGLRMIQLLNKKAIIMVKQKVISIQWEDSIRKFIPEYTVEFLENKKNINTDADIYICNPIIFKNKNKIKFNTNFLKDVKFLINDEVHGLVTRQLCKGFFYIQPSYILSLSATPYRNDEDPFKENINIFFGNNYINNIKSKKFSVIYFNTGFTIKNAPNNTRNKLDWNNVLEHQATNKSRNKLIVKTVNKFKNKTWLILCKRVEHVNLLSAMLLNKNIISKKLYKNLDVKDDDESINVFIGTTLKVGVGFDNPRINALILAADVVNYLEQYIGRVLRTKDKEALIVDFKDSFYPLNKHFHKRLEYYEKNAIKITEIKEKKEEKKENKIS